MTHYALNVGYIMQKQQYCRKQTTVMKKFHKFMTEACHPIDPIPVYIFMVIGLLCPILYYFKLLN